MRELNGQDMIDVLYGCAVLGTGGGGPLASGLELINSFLNSGKKLKLIKLNEIPDEEYIATPYGCGAPSAEGNPKFSKLKVSKKTPPIMAIEACEAALGKKIYAVGSTELGGGNTAEALYAALELNLPLIDADPAGRSVPELQHSSYFVKDVPIYPLGVASKYGDKIFISSVQNDFRAEDIVRSIAVASDNIVGVADHVNKGKVIKEALIPDMISYAQEIGVLLRKSKESNKDVSRSIVEAKKGKILFKGKVVDFPWETRDGFNFGEIHLIGMEDYSGDKYKIWFKNENIISYKNNTVDVTVPDLICMIGEDGEPITTPNFGIGKIMTVFALPAPDIWKTEKGLACFGPKHFGFDIDYKPFK